MENKLKQYFPMIRERKEVLSEIRSHRELEEQFDSWNMEQQEKSLNFCTGVRGIKLLYDGFFKEIMNPEYKPERIDDFLSQILKKRVKVLKVGYLFPGQRSACYSADLLLRQYKRVRSEQKKKFSYRDIKTVYTIILFEKNSKEFQAFPDNYCHFSEQKTDTGLKIELLQKYLFIPLDILKVILHNKGVHSKLEAWLTLFAVDEPDRIIELIEAYPEFKEIYEEAYSICRNVEEVMTMFSRELHELDKNTVQYMIDEMQDTIDSQKGIIDVQKSRIDEMQKILENSILSTIEIMKKSGLSEEKISERIQEHYQLTRERAEQYLCR